MSPSLAKKSATMNVLVVDDESLIRWSLGEVLAEDGHAVAEASSGRSALEQLARGVAFDVIVLDYRLPDSNDLQLLQSIRTLAPATAVIMMTAFGTPEMVAGALKRGAIQVVSKPFDIHDMARVGLGSLLSQIGLPRGSLVLEWSKPLNSHEADRELAVVAQLDDVAPLVG